MRRCATGASSTKPRCASRWQASMTPSRRSGQRDLFERRHERYGRYAAARCAATSNSPRLGMMEHPTRVGNRLLAALPPADFGLLAPYLRQISLKQDAVLVRSGDRNEQAYFPHSGTISFMLAMPNGQTVATAVIGHEGAVGMLSVLGPSRSPTTAAPS